MIRDKKKIRNEQDIQNIVYRNYSNKILILMIIMSIVIGRAVALDCNIGCKVQFYTCIENWLGGSDSKGWELFLEVKRCLAAGLMDLRDLILTVNTILAAVVILFYSVQDNRKEGIPHRVILSYTFGRFTIPIIFVMTMLLLPLDYLFCLSSMKISAFIGIVSSYALQMIIIVLILLTTSHKYSIHAITNSEIRQFRNLVELDKNRVIVESSRHYNEQYLWTYLLHHMEQVIKSEELITDKMELIRRLLKVPYYKKERCLLRKERFTYKENATEAEIRRTYEFYYKNLIPVLEYLNGNKKSEERNKVYQLIYKFLEELATVYEKRKSQAMYLTTVSAIMNAVLMANAEEAEGVCNYIFNECIQDENIGNMQMKLYVLFQEMLYRVNNRAIRLDNLKRNKYFITVGRLGEDMTEKEEDVLVKYWEIWIQELTVSKDFSNRCLRNALETLQGHCSDSIPIFYICTYQRQMRRCLDENKTNTIN